MSLSPSVQARVSVLVVILETQLDRREESGAAGAFRARRSGFDVRTGVASAVCANPDSGTMSRIPKWKIEKTKVKVVFRLQFHATHIPQGWDKLFVSFIPIDTGKATAKTNKVNVRNGSCKWPDPIYETTRFLQDTRTKKYDEKHYKLVVAMGSSRSSLLGDVTINLSGFADALKPSSISLPLANCDFSTTLHVTVQLLTSKTGFREFEQQRELSVKGVQTISSHKNDP
ncbi:unnamed protein product [Musa textilis]